jgi:hypothetical protein
MNPRTVLAVALALSAGPALADGTTVAATAVPVASIAAVGGQVLLAQGADVAPAAAGAALYPGDRVMTLDGAQALIAFEAGCQRRLDGDSLLTIGERPDCAGEPRLVAFRQAIGETGGATKKEEDDDDDKAAMIVDANNATGTTVTRLTPGQRWAVAIALLIPAIYYWDRNRDDDDDRPPVSR